MLSSIILNFRVIYKVVYWALSRRRGLFFSVIKESYNDLSYHQKHTQMKRAGIADALAAYQAISPMAARNAADEFRRLYEVEFPSAVACFADDFEACIAHLRLPIAQRKTTRTTNLLERLFGEERRRTTVIPHAFGERPVLKLMFAALTRASQSWRHIVITEFEIRQLAELRQQLKTEERPKFTPQNLCASRLQFSSKTRT